MHHVQDGRSHSVSCDEWLSAASGLGHTRLGGHSARRLDPDWRTSQKPVRLCSYVQVLWQHRCSQGSRLISVQDEIGVGGARHHRIRVCGRLWASAHNQTKSDQSCHSREKGRPYVNIVFASLPNQS